MVSVRELHAARRAELGESISAVQQALDEGFSVDRLHAALAELAGDLRAHVALSEGPGGLHADIVASAPRLANAVAHLADEHRAILETVEALADATARPDALLGAVRQRVLDVLDRLAKHSQRDTALMYEAIEADLGGETG